MHVPNEPEYLYDAGITNRFSQLISNRFFFSNLYGKLAVLGKKNRAQISEHISETHLNYFELKIIYGFTVFSFSVV